MDTTTLAFLSRGHELPPDTIQSVMDEMLENRTEDGLFYVSTHLGLISRFVLFSTCLSSQN